MTGHHVHEPQDAASSNRPFGRIRDRLSQAVQKCCSGLLGNQCKIGQKPEVFRIVNSERAANHNVQPVSGSVDIRTPIKKDGVQCETRITKTSTNSHFFETMSKRRRGFPSETQVKRGERIVHGSKVLEEKLGRNDLCPCGSGQRFKKCCLRKGCF